MKLVSLGAAARIAPVAAAAACGPAIAWFRHGSIAAPDWLPYAILIGLLVATAAFAGALHRAGRLVVTAIGGLLGLAAWEAVTIAWAAEPNLARDEAVLTVTYAGALALAALLPRPALDRLLALQATAFVLGIYTLACALRFRFGAHPLFGEGRPADPISYINAGGALWALGVWPGVAVAARRGSNPAVRALALAAAAIGLAGVVSSQSKGAVLGIAVSAAVVFAVSGRRVRIAVPFLIAVVAAVAASVPLTEPYRVHPAGLAGAIHGVGTAMIAVAAAAGIAGAVYAVLDRRVTPSPAAVRRTGRVLAALIAAGAIAALVVALAPHPVRTIDREWRSAHHSATQTSTTHLAALGSNRFDFWRVAGDGFLAHPAFGIGARGFGPYYLMHGSSYETPARAHSLPLEVLLEDGLVGFALLAAGLGALLVAVGRGARARRATAVAALGAATGAIAQMCVDWTWTFPAVGIPLFVIAGLGVLPAAAPGPRRASAAAAAVALVLLILVLAPEYVSARIATRAVGDGSTARLDWASRLDPLSPQPDIARYELSPTLEGRLAAAGALVRRQPRAIAYQYLYGVTLAAAGRTADARASLERALALHPGDPVVTRALRSLPRQ